MLYTQTVRKTQNTCKSTLFFPQTWYAYVQNDPVNFRDLFGLSAADSSAKSKSGPVLDMSNSGNRNPYEGIKTGLTDEQLDFIFSTEMRNLVGIPKKTVEHVNVGVGQRNQEEKEQIIDATEGLTMNARNNNPAR